MSTNIDKLRMVLKALETAAHAPFEKEVEVVRQLIDSIERRERGSAPVLWINGFSDERTQDEETAFMWEFNGDAVTRCYPEGTLAATDVPGYTDAQLARVYYEANHREGPVSVPAPSECTFKAMRAMVNKA